MDLSFSSPDGEKRRLRKEMIESRRRLSPANRVIHSATILQRLFELEVMRGALWVQFYVSYRSEVETSGMIAHALSHGKKVAVPKVIPKKGLLLSEIQHPVHDLAPGWRGIPEPREGCIRPVDVGEMDVLVIPGIAFDMNGNRLGQGAGIYDRVLKSVKGVVPIIALAFELQIVKEIPVQAEDIQVDFIITEKQTISCREEK